MRFIVDQADTLGKPMLPQRCRDLKTGMAGADNDHRTIASLDSPFPQDTSVTHVVSSLADFGLLCPGGAGARVRP